MVTTTKNTTNIIELKLFKANFALGLRYTNNRVIIKYAMALTIK
jgi:hypothetical protein